MVDEQKFEDPLAHLLHIGGVGVNLHSRRDRGGAGNGRPRGFGDLGCAVWTNDGFAVGAKCGRAELNQAHTAITGNGQAGMIAIMRDVDVCGRASLNHGGGQRLAGNRIRHSLRHFDWLTIHLHLDFIDGWNGRCGSFDWVC